MALEDVLKGQKKGDVGTTGESVPLQSALEKELAADDNALANDLARSRAEEIIESRNLRIQQIRTHRLNQGRSGKAENDDGGRESGGTREPARGKEWLLDYTTGLLSKGMDPIQVGRLVDYLIGGNSYLPAVGLPGAGAPAGGLTFDNVIALANMLKENNNKTDPTLNALLTKLTEKIEAVEKVAAARSTAQPEKRTAYIVIKGVIEEISMDRPILIEPENDAGAKSIEMVKEENRHAEEIERLKTDKEHKNSIANTLASIPEKIGRGLAGEIAGGGEIDVPSQAPGAKTAEQEQFTCPECKTEFMIPAGALQFTCPNCTQTDGSPSVFSRTKK
jgi:DNA-directed RNA polymerase subunit M/transcription elongation factor TFIIS